MTFREYLESEYDERTLPHLLGNRSNWYQLCDYRQSVELLERFRDDIHDVLQGCRLFKDGTGAIRIEYGSIRAAVWRAAAGKGESQLSSL